MTSSTIRDLRRRWKPHKERLQQQLRDHPTAIRFHRACSWLDQSIKQIESNDHDLALINQWIAFNALYGQWDTDKNDPYPDRESWQQFCARMLVLDESELIADTLKEHKRLVMSLLEDEYLSGYFWKDPTEKRARQSKKGMYDARTWYVENRWPLILERSLERVYLMRCQLVHAAATHGGRLNRTALKRCHWALQNPPPMGALKSAGERIVGLMTQRVISLCFRRFALGLQGVLSRFPRREPVGAFGGF